MELASSKNSRAFRPQSVRYQAVRDAKLPAKTAASVTRPKPQDQRKIDDGRIQKTIDPQSKAGRDIGGRLNNAGARVGGVASGLPDFLVGDVLAKLPTRRGGLVKPAIGSIFVPGGNAEPPSGDVGKALLNDLLNSSRGGSRSGSKPDRQSSLDQARNRGFGDAPLSPRQKQAFNAGDDFIAGVGQAVGAAAGLLGSAAGSGAAVAGATAAGGAAAGAAASAGLLIGAGGAGIVIGAGADKAYKAFFGKSLGTHIGDAVEAVKVALPNTEAGQNDRAAKDAHNKRTAKELVRKVNEQNAKDEETRQMGRDIARRARAHHDAQQQKAEEAKKNQPKQEPPKNEQDTKPVPDSIAGQYGPAPSESVFRARVREIHSGLTNPRGMENQRPHVDPETLKASERGTPRQGLAINWGPDGPPVLDGDAPLPENGVADPPEGFGDLTNPSGNGVAG